MHVRMTAHNLALKMAVEGWREADDRGHREQQYVVRLPPHCFGQQQWLCQPSPLVAVRGGDSEDMV